MKKMVFISALAFAGITLSYQAQAQIWKRIKNKVKETAENHVVNDAGETTNKVIDKAENTASKTIRGNNKKNNNTTPTVSSPQTATSATAVTTTTTTAATTAAPPTTTSYKSYDFVPGDNIIFETDFKNQQDAALPARLGTLRGNAEIETYKGEKVLHINSGNNVCIIPVMDGGTYLPKQFTVEFDFLYNAGNPSEFNQIEMNFYKPNRDRDYIASNYGDYHFLIYEAEQIDFGKTIQGRKLQKPVVNSLKVPYKWHHIAIYIHGNIGKVYIDQYRVAASNMMMAGMAKLAVKTNGRMDYLIKNLRIAGGGSDAYHKIITEGKFITHGIYFASGKADILPESMGTINEVFNIMKKHPDLKFEIDGYTDNTGSADLNLKLSQQRADAVKDQLTNMGIPENRLTAKGYGEQDPIDTNTTYEGKANNRRVEFVKQK